MVRDWDDNEFPLAYLISFRTYGTWLHGDERGSMSRKQNKYGTPRIAYNPELQQAERAQLKYPPITLDSCQRPVVEAAIREVCEYRGYSLRAFNIRTNHVHTVVSAAMKPEPILQAFQAYATRKLRDKGCYLEMSNHGHDMGARRISGKKGTLNVRLSTCCMGKVMSCRALMIEVPRWMTSPP